MPTFDLCQQERGTTRVLAILDVVEKWDALICLITIARLHDQRLHGELAHRLRQWVQQDNITYHGPQPTQRAQLAALLADSLGGEPLFFMEPGGPSGELHRENWAGRLRFILKCNQVLG